jgi:hypothetical protein
MLANVSPYGMDLLTLMATTAAQCSASQLIGRTRLAKCESFDLVEGYLPEDITLECWPVFADHQAVVVQVVATAPREDEMPLVAGRGRFTFTTLTHKREYRA